MTDNNERDLERLKEQVERRKREEFERTKKEIGNTNSIVENEDNYEGYRPTNELDDDDAPEED